MRINLRGVRGSIPTSGPGVKYYGGNTSCVEISAEGWKLVLDGGSGISNVTWHEELNHNRIDILLTHLHMDHIQGLGFCKPFFDPAMEMHIWGPASTTQSLHERLSLYLSPPLFPVHIRDLPCKLHLHEIDKKNFEIGPFKIYSDYIIHPGPTVGFRIHYRSAVFTYMPDHEPALGVSGILEDTRWVSGIDLAKGSDLLLHDAQWTAAEYPQRMGWGHSSMDDAILFASMAAVKHLLMVHHDPGRTDDMLNEMFNEVKNRSAVSFSFEPAYEGMEILLG
ncbi:MAG TPA: MBL fold metallo-hydrolase [Chitinophagaceae bacterium]|nr:MBL fold metallo-hydrolase [Chitinophagaceae bacterium]MCB9055137.1 MBL fold metallo-hydrolase [Chitinophagales bacterium]HRX94196.1 MBL fold metallo-hydrolase [Chitinophagaceae bacterium]